jgi:hypothetical protein
MEWKRPDRPGSSAEKLVDGTQLAAGGQSEGARAEIESKVCAE